MYFCVIATAEVCFKALCVRACVRACGRARDELRAWNSEQ